jgi:hypothetical protein
VALGINAKGPKKNVRPIKQRRIPACITDPRSH